MGLECPSAFELRAALSVARLLSEEGNDTLGVRSAYWTLPSDGQFSVEDLQRGERLLQHCELVAPVDGRLMPVDSLWAILEAPAELQRELLFQRWAEVASFPWAPGLLATDLAGAREVLPVEIVELVDQLPDSDGALERLLLALARRADDTVRKEIGAAGERHVVDEWRRRLQEASLPSLVSRLSHVSLVSDQLGYDIVAPYSAGGQYRLEVKSSTRQLFGKFELFLSRGEFTAALRYPEWRLVLCLVNPSGTPQVLGWVGVGDLLAIVPVDAGDSGRWESARLTIPLTHVTEGLPPLTE